MQFRHADSTESSTLPAPPAVSAALQPVPVAAAKADRRARERRAGWARGWYLLIAVSALGLVSFAGTLAERYVIGREMQGLRTDFSRLAEMNDDLSAMNAQLHARLEGLEAANERWAQEHGIFPVKFLQERSQSVLEVHSQWDPHKEYESHSSGAHLGNGYFLTVKHGVFRTSHQGEAKPAHRITLTMSGRRILAQVVDAGEANRLSSGTEWGDWAVIKAEEPVALPSLPLRLDYPFEFGDPIARFGNDWGKGILFTTGYLGRRIDTGLYTTLAATHSGISGGPVIDTKGRVIAISVGKQLDGDNFAYMQPIVADMLRKVR